MKSKTRIKQVKTMRRALQNVRASAWFVGLWTPAVTPAAGGLSYTTGSFFSEICEIQCKINYRLEKCVTD